MSSGGFAAAHPVNNRDRRALTRRCGLLWRSQCPMVSPMRGGLCPNRGVNAAYICVLIANICVLLIHICVFLNDICVLLVYICVFLAYICVLLNDICVLLIHICAFLANICVLVAGGTAYICAALLRGFHPHTPAQSTRPQGVELELRHGVAHAIPPISTSARRL